MFNMPLFKLEWKSNYKILIIFCLILTMYITIMIGMYDPKLGNALETFSKSMPEIMAMVGMSGTPTTLIEFISTYLYGLIMILFPLVFGIIITLRLIVKKIDNGVMSYLLSNGINRKTVWFTQLIVIASTMLVLISYCTLLGLLCANIMFPNKLDITAYLSINFGVYILHLSLLSICFMFSCIFNEYHLATLFGAGIPVVFILLQMLANMQGSMEWLKYTTILSLYNPTKLINGNSNGYLMLVGLGFIIIICNYVGMYYFNKKSISL